MEAAEEQKEEKPSPFAAMSDGDILERIALGKQELRRVEDILKPMIQDLENEMEARIRKRMKEHGESACAVPHPLFEKVALEKSYTPYRADIDKLVEAAKGLPPEDAAKVVKFVPEQITKIDAHYVMGNVGSIKSLATKFAGTDVGKNLEQGIKRDFLGWNLVIKMRPGVEIPAE